MPVCVNAFYQARECAYSVSGHFPPRLNLINFVYRIVVCIYLSVSLTSEPKIGIINEVRVGSIYFHHYSIMHGVSKSSLRTITDHYMS